MALGATAAALVLTGAFRFYLPHSMFAFVLAAVALSAWYGGLGPALIATVLGVLSVAYLILPPTPSAEPEGASALGLAIVLVVALTVSMLSEARRRATASAREQSRWLHTTLESIGDAVVATDSAGRVSFMNAVAETLTGWPAEEARGRPIDEVFRIMDGATRRPAESPVARVLREGTAVSLASRTLLIARDGTERPIDDSGAPIQAEGEDAAGVILVFRDRTDRSRTAEELSRGRQRLELALEAAHMGSWTYDVASGRVEWSENLAAVLGLAPGSFGGTYEDFIRLVHPDDRSGVSAAVEKTLADGSEYEHEFRIVRDDGSEAWILGKGRLILDEAGAPACLAGVGMDVTARRRSEEERARLLAREREARRDAEEAERRSRFLSEAALTLASSLDYESTLTRVTRIAVPEVADWCAIDLKGADELVRRVAIAHRDPAKVEQAWQLERRSSGLDAPLEVPRVLRTGSAEIYPEITDRDLQASARDPEHLAALRARGIRSAMCVPMVARGRTLGAVSLSYAESGRRYGRADLELAEHLARRCALAVDNARLYREAQEANRIKDEFLATLSHELRTPLNAIGGWTYLLRQKTLAAGEAETALEIIERNTRAQAQLVDDLLDVSRIVTGRLRLELAPLELSTIVSAAVDVVLPMAETKGIRVEPAIDRGDLPILGDPNRLQQAVWNLLSNAVKFTPRGGRVDVLLERAGSRARLTVKDTGRGISREFLPHLFERFWQADSTHARRHGGLGLGLAIVRHIAELHAGTVTADSPGEDAGSVFVLELPLRAAGDRQAVRAPATLEAHALDLPSLSRIRVLVVEDEPDTRELLSMLLTRAGAEVVAVPGAAEALAEIERRTPDVLVSDLGLPGTDGYELMRRVKDFELRHGARIPAVALTAYALEEDRRRALGTGFEIHVTKPVEPVELATAIADLARARSPLSRSERPDATSPPPDLSPATAARPRATP